MGDFTATSRSIVGMPTEKTWAQTFSHEGLFGVISLFGDDTISLPVVGRDIIEILEREYSNLQTKNLSSLGRMVMPIFEKNVTLNICLVMAVNIGRILYLINHGGGQVILRRGNRQEVILSPADKSASGILESGDTTVLLTKGLSTLVSTAQLNKSLENLMPEAICDLLAPLISEGAESSLAAGLVIHFEKMVDKNSYSNNFTSVEIKENTMVLGRLVILQNILNKGTLFCISLVKKMGNFFNVHLRFFRRPSFEPKDRTTSLPEGIYLHKRDETTSKSRQMLLTVGIILIALLLTSAVLGINKRSREEKLASFTNLYNLSELKYNDGKALISLNPVRARTLLSDSKKTAEEARISVLKEKSELAKTEMLLKNINEALEGISGVYRLSDAPIFFDLSVVREKGVGSKLSLNNQKLAILDNVNNSVYIMSLEKKGAEIVAGGVENFTNSRFISLHGDFAYVLSDRGITEIDINKKTSKLVVKRDDTWGDIGGLYEFGAFRGNIYLLDKKNSRILKYISSDSGFLSTKDYLAPEIKPDFSKASSMAIDGSVWVFSNGKILRFTQGKPDFFNLIGLDTDFMPTATVFTDEDSKNLYVLDPKNKRVVVIDKDKKTGEYVGQYIWEGLAQVSDFVVDETNKKMYLLSGSKIFLVNLK